MKSKDFELEQSNTRCVCVFYIRINNNVKNINVLDIRTKYVRLQRRGVDYLANRPYPTRIVYYYNTSLFAYRVYGCSRRIEKIKNYNFHDRIICLLLFLF